MRKCAYCRNDRSLTKEHVIPKFLYTFMKNCGGDQSGFSPKTGKLIKAESVIKDVCSDCNGGELSKLDSYAKKLYEENKLLTCRYNRDIINFNYDYDLLLRWVLKLLYNSYRTSYKNLSIYESYIKYMLTGVAPNELKDLYLIAELITISSDGGKHNQFSTFIFDEVNINNHFLVARAKIGAMCFYLIMFEAGQNNGNKKRMIKKFIKANGGNMSILSRKNNEKTIEKTINTLAEFPIVHFPKIS